MGLKGFDWNDEIEIACRGLSVGLVKHPVKHIIAKQNGIMLGAKFAMAFADMVNLSSRVEAVA